MAAPAQAITHGTAQTLIAISNEPSVTPEVMVAEISKKFDRDSVQTKNTSQAVVYEVMVNPRVVISFTGQLALDSGLGNEGPGEAVATVANFAATDRDFDPATGKHILENIEDSTKNLDRSPNTKFDIRHQPHIVTA